MYVPGANVTTPPPMALQLAMAALIASVPAPALTGQLRSGKVGSFTAAGLLNIPGCCAGGGEAGGGAEGGGPLSTGEAPPAPPLLPLRRPAPGPAPARGAGPAREARPRPARRAVSGPGPWRAAHRAPAARCPRSSPEPAGSPRADRRGRRVDTATSTPSRRAGPPTSFQLAGPERSEGTRLLTTTDQNVSVAGTPERGGIEQTPPCSVRARITRPLPRNRPTRRAGAVPERGLGPAFVAEQQRPACSGAPG